MIQGSIAINNNNFFFALTILPVKDRLRSLTSGKSMSISCRVFLVAIHATLPSYHFQLLSVLYKVKMLNIARGEVFECA